MAVTKTQSTIINMQSNTLKTRLRVVRNSCHDWRPQAYSAIPKSCCEADFAAVSRGSSLALAQSLVGHREGFDDFLAAPNTDVMQLVHAFTIFRLLSEIFIVCWVDTRGGCTTATISAECQSPWVVLLDIETCDVLRADDPDVQAFALLGSQHVSSDASSRFARSAMAHPNPRHEELHDSDEELSPIEWEFLLATEQAIEADKRGRIDAMLAKFDEESDHPSDDDPQDANSGEQMTSGQAGEAHKDEVPELNSTQDNSSQATPHDGDKVAVRPAQLDEGGHEIGVVCGGVGTSGLLGATAERSPTAERLTLRPGEFATRLVALPSVEPLVVEAATGLRRVRLRRQPHDPDPLESLSCQAMDALASKGSAVQKAKVSRPLTVARRAGKNVRADKLSPIWLDRKRIVNAIRDDISLFAYPTGTGKTSVCPLVILEEDPNKRMIILEPRRLLVEKAARALSKSLPKDAVGWAHGGGREGHKDGNQVFITTPDWLNVRLQSRPTMCLSDVDCDMLIVDEVHERSDAVDWLVGAAIAKGITVVGMTATPDSNLPDSFANAARLSSPTTSYAIEVIERETVVERHPQMASWVPLDNPNNINWAEVGNWVAAQSWQGDALLFVPGRAETDEVLAGAKEMSPGLTTTTMSSGHTRVGVTRGLKRLIVSTSVAESGVTLPNLKLVIISGVGRTSVSKQGPGPDESETFWLDDSRIKQQIGRVGRTSTGTALVLCDRTSLPPPRLSYPGRDTIRFWAEGAQRSEGYRNLIERSPSLTLSVMDFPTAVSTARIERRAINRSAVNRNAYQEIAGPYATWAALAGLFGVAHIVGTFVAASAWKYQGSPWANRMNLDTSQSLGLAGDEQASEFMFAETLSHQLSPLTDLELKQKGLPSQEELRAAIQARSAWATLNAKQSDLINLQNTRDRVDVAIACGVLSGDLDVVERPDGGWSSPSHSRMNMDWAETTVRYNGRTTQPSCYMEDQQCPLAVGLKKPNLRRWALVGPASPFLKSLRFDTKDLNFKVDQLLNAMASDACPPAALEQFALLASSTWVMDV